MAVSVDDVQDAIGASVVDEDYLERCLDAVKLSLAAFYVLPDDEEDWTADIDHAVIMRTVKLYRRKDSPDGLREFAGGEVISYVSKYDPDVDALLARYRMLAIA